MYRVLIPAILFVLQPILTGWAQEIQGAGGGLLAQAQSIGSGMGVAISEPTAEAVIASATPPEVKDVLDQVRDSLRNVELLKEFADQLRKTPQDEMSLRRMQATLQQQRRKLEEKQAELEVMGARLRGQAEGARGRRAEIRRELEGTFPEMKPEMPGMEGMGMMGGMGMGMPGGMGMMGGGVGFGGQAEIEMRAIPLKTSVPEKMLEMVKPLLRMDESFVYDPRTRVVILRGDKETLGRATDFINQLEQTYREALEAKGLDPFGELPLEPTDSAPASQTIQIEALLMEGSKLEDATREVTAEELPKEALAIGLKPSDLMPFGRLDLVATGPVMLQTVMDPDRAGNPVKTRLGEYSLTLMFSGPLVNIELNWPNRELGGTLLSNVVKATQFDRPVLMVGVSPENSTVILVIRFKQG